MESDTTNKLISRLQLSRTQNEFGREIHIPTIYKHFYYFYILFKICGRVLSKFNIGNYCTCGEKQLFILPNYDCERKIKHFLGND